MQNNIHTLITDIYHIVKAKNGWFTNELATDFSSSLASVLQAQLGEKDRKPTLRMSALGPKCPKALWHSIHTPELAEPFPPQALIKFSYGHILEHLAIMMAKASGHHVVGEQDECEIDGVLGHRDCVIDGNIVDVKSCSSIQFLKFKDKTISFSDSFGYLDQLDAYLVAAADDPLVTNKESAFILAIDKTLGHLCLYEHRKREDSIRRRISDYKGIVSRSHPPGCECRSVPDGKSGNLKLDTKASYNAYKYACNPSLRVFLYAGGPVYLTKVVRTPDVLEVDRHGQTVYS